MRRVPAHEIIKEEGEEEKKKAQRKCFIARPPRGLLSNPPESLFSVTELKKNQSEPVSLREHRAGWVFLHQMSRAWLKPSPTDRLPHPLNCHCSGLTSLSIILTSFSSSSSIRECEEWATAGPGGVKQPLMDDSVLPLNRQGSTGQVSHLGSEVAD